MKAHPTIRNATILLAAAGLLLLAGCGGAYGEVYVDDGAYLPIADVEVDNQTDLGGTFEDLYSFDVAPSGTPYWSGNLLPDVIFPGETAFVGSFDEDWYDAEADLDLGLVTFFDVFVEGGFTTTFEVF